MKFLEADSLCLEEFSVESFDDEQQDLCMYVLD